MYEYRYNKLISYAVPDTMVWYRAPAHTYTAGPLRSNYTKYYNYTAPGTRIILYEVVTVYIPRKGTGSQASRYLGREPQVYGVDCVGPMNAYPCCIYVS